MQPEDIAYDICRYYIHDLTGVDSALFAKIDGFRRSRNLAELTSCSCHFDWHRHTINDWRALRQVEAFFKKNANLANKDVCQEASKASFLNAEEACHKTNIRLQPYVGYPGLLDQKYQRLVQRMARYISNVLGDVKTFIDELPSLVKVTPGATAHTSRRNSLPQLKLKMKLYATRRVSKYVKDLYNHFGFNDPRIRPVHSNRVELVPKNWKTDRTIACEPEGNLPFQLAFDTFAKRRLRRFGIDLSDQSANIKRAKHASVHNDYVTVDFSAASDTIAYNTVALVFPVEWFSFLCDVRTPGYRGVFGDGVYSKFSSMGNGSTFCIETLIFAAACYAVGSSNFLVYGDDVIIEKEFYEDYLALTGFLGFTINQEKTYSQGPFRESCGGDFFNGIDVAPIFIRSIDRRKANLCHLVNTIGSIATLDGTLEAYLTNLIVEYKLPFVPYNESTISGVWINPDIARRKGILRTWLRKPNDQIHSFKSYVAKHKKRVFVDSRGYYLWFLRKNSQVLFSGPWWLSAMNSVSDQNSSETSSVAVYDHAYVRKRLRWISAQGMPDRLYCWPES
jgi:hypothetical protein